MGDVLVGGSGFVGHHISNLLMGEGKEFSILDMRPPSGNDGFISCDITKPMEIAHAGLETVYHLAALRNPRQAQDEMRATFNTNVAGTFNVCDWARRNDAKEIVFFSSYAVYGNVGKCSEKDPVLPCNNYSFSKAEGELVVANFCRNYGMKCAIVRPAPMYGPGLREGLGADLVLRAKKDRKLEFSGDGRQTRQYLHIDDMVEGMRLARDAGGTYNVAGSASISVREIAGIVSEKMGGVPVKFGESSGDFKGDIKGSAMECAALQALGWAPLKDFWKHYPAYLDEVIKAV